jgi:hypothetical protein
LISKNSHPNQEFLNKIMAASIACMRELYSVGFKFEAVSEGKIKNLYSDGGSV